jgi:lactoylglutathione lyase
VEVALPIEHVALWTHDIERLKDFYTRYFGATAPHKYQRVGFESYFLTFESGARLELMQAPQIPANANDADKQAVGWIHVAFSVGSRETVDALTAQLRADGFRILSEPHVTGDGYYESTMLDPDGNRVEITV